jgi:hypothetical protein
LQQHYGPRFNCLKDNEPSQHVARVACGMHGSACKHNLVFCELSVLGLRLSK